ncbi:MAG: hypothetical protein ACYC6L_04405 [Anaerolineae bacterium]
MEILVFILVALAGFTVFDRKYWRQQRNSRRQEIHHPTTIIIPVTSAVLNPVPPINSKIHSAWS